jgi:peroxiredoxin
MSERPLWRRVVRGWLEGFVSVGLGASLANLLWGEQSLWALWPLGGVYAFFGGLMFAVGRGVASGVVGACLGGLIGYYAAEASTGWIERALRERVSWQIVSYRDARIQPGQMLNLAGPTLDGKELDLEGYRGKVVLVEFWASWCRESLRQLPDLRRLYDKHHKNGFEVVGISLDQNRSQLLSCIEREHIPWPEIYFDEDGKRAWSNPLAKKCDIHETPTSFLVNREGVVMGVNLQGPMLESALLLCLEGKNPVSGPRRDVVIIPIGRYVTLILGLVLGCVCGAMAQRWLAALWRGKTPTEGAPTEQVA